jgi:hypothetical protein
LEVVRGSRPSASVDAPARKAACLCQHPPPDALLLMVVYLCLAPDAVEECLPPGVALERLLDEPRWDPKRELSMEPKDAQRARAVESERAHSLQARWVQVSAHWAH